MKIAEINKKTNEVVHVFESSKMPVFNSDYINYCEDITDKNVIQGDVKKDTGFERPEKVAIEEHTTIDTIMAKLVEIETILNNLGVAK